MTLASVFLMKPADAKLLADPVSAQALATGWQPDCVSDLLTSRCIYGLCLADVPPIEKTFPLKVDSSRLSDAVGETSHP